MFGYSKKLDLLRDAAREVHKSNLALSQEIGDLHRRQLAIEGFMRDAAAHNTHVQVLIDRIIELSMLVQGHPQEALAHRNVTKTVSQVKEDWNEPDADAWPPEDTTVIDSIG